VDKLYAGDGDDVVRSSGDGERDTVDCGAGDGDRAVVDPGDYVTNCEKVQVELG
jgi:hypothetical protein